MNNGKSIALITGASSGIGAEFACQLAKNGHDLILHGRREEKLKELTLELQSNYKVKIKLVIAELSNPQEVKKIEEMIKATPDIEILINNAGFGSTEGAFFDKKNDERLDMLYVHVSVPLIFTYAVIENMKRKRRGSIINVSSIAGFLVTPSSSIYSASKAMFTNITESIALDLRDQKIKVQALCPGFTRTDFHEKIGWEDGDKRYKALKFMTCNEVVRCSLENLGGRVVVIPGIRNRILVFMAQVIPKRILYFLARNYTKKKK